MDKFEHNTNTTDPTTPLALFLGVTTSLVLVPKTIIKMLQTASLHCMHALEEFDSAVYGDMHSKDILGSTARGGYCIPVPDFYLVLHGLRGQKAL